MKTRQLVPGLAAVTVTAALTLSATLVTTSGARTATAAENQRTLTFRLSEKRAAAKYIDLARKGPSIGDRHLTSMSIEKNGATAGRLEIECVAIDRVYEGQTCDVAAQLADGTLYFEGIGFHKRVPRVGTGDDTVYAVTGGSGAYLGAEGTVTIGLADTGPVTITLLPQD